MISFIINSHFSSIPVFSYKLQMNLMHERNHGRLPGGRSAPPRPRQLHTLPLISVVKLSPPPLEVLPTAPLSCSSFKQLENGCRISPRCARVTESLFLQEGIISRKTRRDMSLPKGIPPPHFQPSHTLIKSLSANF